MDKVRMAVFRPRVGCNWQHSVMIEISDTAMARIVQFRQKWLDCLPKKLMRLLCSFLAGLHFFICPPRHLAKTDHVVIFVGLLSCLFCCRLLEGIYCVCWIFACSIARAMNIVGI